MKKCHFMFVVLFLIVGTLLGVLSMTTPYAKDGDDETFSAQRAKLHIKEIAQKPHDITMPEELKEVRDYIISELDELGLSSEIHTYDSVDDVYGEIEVNNIFSTIEGQNDSYIMIVAHYDSSPKKRTGEEAGSKGAADDGYGVSIMLEIANVIKNQDKELINGIKLLFTDAEEVGLHGAGLEVKNNPELFSNVGFLINLEARGIKGPAIMFETSNDNRKVIDFYRNANMPVGYSLASDVYRQMPNGTDFTKFINAGINGINFAVLDSLDYYHTPKDNYDNISLSSLQHYGEQVLPLVEEYIYHSTYSDVNYFETNGNTVYFPLLPNLFVTYSVSVGYVLMVILVILLILLMIYSRKKTLFTYTGILKWLGLLTGLTIMSLFVGLGVTKLISLLTGINFSLTYMPKVPLAIVIFIVMLLTMVGFFLFVFGKFTKTEKELNQTYLSSLLFNSILLLIFMIVLPGGSYLFLWTTFTSLVVFFIQKHFSLSTLIYGINIVVCTLLYVPVLYLLFLALTIGSLPIILLFAVFPLTIISISSTKMIQDNNN